MFLRNNNRMTALITVICLALLIYCLVEREVRNAIAPATTLPNLNAGRPAKPTANLIFKALRPLRLIPARNGNPPVIPQPAPLQLRLLNLLAVDPRRPRDG
jgi:transposase